MYNPNVVFGVGMFEEYTCFEQVSVISSNSLENILISFFLVCTLENNFVTTYLCKFRFNESCLVFYHLNAFGRGGKPSYLVVKT